MTDQERDIISRFIARIGGASAQPAAFGSVPETQPAAPLPPIDKDADALIADLFTQHPEARYRLTQLAFVQEHALAEAQNRIAQLQQLLHAQQAAQAPAAPSPWGQPAQPRGAYGGGPAPQYAPPPQPSPPSYPDAMMQPQGTGFLGSALRTAAGVAGGMFVGNALMTLFSGGHGGFGGGYPGGGFGGPPGTVINETNVYEQAPAASPWSGTPADASLDTRTTPPPDPALQQADWTDPNLDSGFDPASGGDFDNT